MPSATLVVVCVNSSSSGAGEAFQSNAVLIFVCVCRIPNFLAHTESWLEWHLHQKGIQSDLLAKFSVWKFERMVQTLLLIRILKTVELCILSN